MPYTNLSPAMSAIAITFMYAFAFIGVYFAARG